MKQTKLNFGPRPSEGSKGKQQEEAERIPDSEGEELSSVPNTPPKESALEYDSDESELTDDEEISVLVAPPRQATNGSSSSSAPLRPVTLKFVTTNGNVVGDISTSSADTSNGQVKKRGANGTGSTCHTHTARCKDLTRCTFMAGQKTKKRCPMKYCSKSVELYGTTMERIKSVKRSSVSASVQDSHSEEESFIFKCPRCQEICICLRCRRKKGLEPVERSLQAQTIRNDQLNKLIESNPVASTSKDGAPRPSVLPAAPERSGFAAGGQLPARQVKPTAPKPTASKPSGSPSIKRSHSKFKFVVPVKKPKDLMAPELEKIETELPAENLFARAYIYETLNRFSLMKTSRSLVNKLDRFDQWTSKVVQDILERILLLLSALEKLESGSPVATMIPVIRAWRKTGKDLSRGEVWKQATALLEEMETLIFKLTEVEHEEEEEAEEEEQDLMPLSISRRLTRRRAANNSNGKDYRDEVSSEDSQDEHDEQGSSSDSGSSEEEESDHSTNLEGHRRSTRTKTAVIKEGRRSGGDTSMSSVKNGEVAKVKKEVKEVEKVPSPPLEEKIEILVGLLDLAMGTQNVADDLKEAVEGLAALEKSRKESDKARSAEFAEASKKYEESNPGPFTGEPHRTWADKKMEMNRKKLEDDRDADMRFKLKWDALKLRSGPLGHDADGNEYWQLSQCDKSMPAQTAGRYSWSLLVYGIGFISPIKPSSETNDIIIDDDDSEDEKVAKGKEENKISNKRVNGNGKEHDDDASSLSSAGDSEDGKTSQKKIKTDVSGKGKAVVNGVSNGSNGGLKGKGKVEEGLSKDEKAFYGTNYPKEINNLMTFVRYRQQCKDHQEWISLARDPAKANKSASDRLTSDQLYRKKQVDALITRLEEIREYYIWQTGDELWNPK